MPTFTHGKNTYISVDGTDLSTYTNTSALTSGADSHDTTTYGKNDHVFQGGLKTGTFTFGGLYGAGVSGTPGSVLDVLVGSTVTIIRRCEGTGVGKPAESFSAVITSYVETNPVADMVTWSCEATVSDAVTRTTQ